MHHAVNFTFGLGAADSVILHNAAGAASTVHVDRNADLGGCSRCPNGTGAIVNRPLAGRAGQQLP